jgi:hypothetical protein
MLPASTTAVDESLPGSDGDALRCAQADLAVPFRTRFNHDRDADLLGQRSVGDHALSMVDRDVRDTETEDSEPTVENPVLVNPLMQLTMEDFKTCRITPGGRISVIDAIGRVNGGSKESTKKIWLRLSHGDKTVPMGIPVEFHQFSSRGGPMTPVATLNNLLQILALIPGPQGDALRKAQAELAARSISGDHDLETALPTRREELGAFIGNVRYFQ